MATLIRLKRKKSTGNTNVILTAGEPYYNLSDKRLYIGNTDGELVTDKKHVAQIVDKGTTKDGKISFQIGEDEANTYTKELYYSELAGRPTVDGELKSNSTNAIQNKAVKTKFDSVDSEINSLKTANQSINSTLNNKASVNHSHSAVEIAGLAAVARSGSYDDLKNKPSIPSGVIVDSSLNTTSTNAIQNKVVTAELNKKANTGHTHKYDSSTSSASENAIQNKAVTQALNGKASTSHTHNASNITAGTLPAARLATSGVTAGTYTSVTVDKYGRVTEGSNIPRVTSQSYDHNDNNNPRKSYRTWSDGAKEVWIYYTGTLKTTATDEWQKNRYEITLPVTFNNSNYLVFPVFTGSAIIKQWFVTKQTDNLTIMLEAGSKETSFSMSVYIYGV